MNDEPRRESAPARFCRLSYGAWKQADHIKIALADASPAMQAVVEQAFQEGFDAALTCSQIEQERLSHKP